MSNVTTTIKIELPLTEGQHDMIAEGGYDCLIYIMIDQLKKYCGTTKIKILEYKPSAIRANLDSE